MQLAKLIPRLASDHDGEIVATVKAIGRTLKNAGSDFHALAAVVERGPFTQHRDEEYVSKTAANETARRCLLNDRGRLSHRERLFVDSMTRWEGTPTIRQSAWLQVIASKLRAAA